MGNKVISGIFNQKCSFRLQSSHMKLVYYDKQNVLKGYTRKKMTVHTGNNSINEIITVLFCPVCCTISNTIKYFTKFSVQREKLQSCKLCVHFNQLLTMTTVSTVTTELNGNVVSFASTVQKSKVFCSFGTHSWGQPSKNDEWWTIEMQKYNLWPSGITKGKSITAANPTDIFVWAEVVDQLPDQRNPA